LFRNEIDNYHEVIYYGDGYPDYDKNLTAPQILNNYDNIDLILTYGLRYTLPFKDIGKIKKVKKAHIIIDLFPPHPLGYKGGMYNRQKPFLHENDYDILFYRQLDQKEYLKQIKCFKPAYWLPFSVDINIYKNKKLTKIYDVLTSATVRNDVYPNREKINKLIKKMNLKLINKRVIHEAYINAINQSKIAIISVNCFNTLNMKFTEFTSCGTFVLADRALGMKKLGFVNNKHFVLYKDINDLQNKIIYYLKHEKEREIIAHQGMNFTRKNHNNKKRIEYMFNIIDKELNLC
jgi:hypothetical protein